MAKKYITVKCKTTRRLYLSDISKVYSINIRKTPSLPKFQDIDSDTQC
jgi:hypothetical protein